MPITLCPGTSISQSLPWIYCEKCPRNRNCLIALWREGQCSGALGPPGRGERVSELWTSPLLSPWGPLNLRTTELQGWRETSPPLFPLQLRNLGCLRGRGRGASPAGGREEGGAAVLPPAPHCPRPNEGRPAPGLSGPPAPRASQAPPTPRMSRRGPAASPGHTPSQTWRPCAPGVCNPDGRKDTQMAGISSRMKKGASVSSMFLKK